MKFAAATFLALVALAGAKKTQHSECGLGAVHSHKHKHHSSSAVHSETISFSSVGGIHTTSVAASSSVSASTAIASATSTRSTVKVTSTVTTSTVSSAAATTNIAIATSVGVNSPSHAVTSSRSTVKVTSTVTASSTSVAASTTPKATSTTSKAVTSSTKPATTAVPTKITTPVSSLSTKRGLGFNALSATLPFSGAVSWAYNWDSQHASGSLATGAEFVPMLWGTGNDHVSQWTKNAQAAIDNGATHLLGFNEPDLSSQSNLSPKQAADAWKKYMQPFAGKAKLVSPAVTNGGPPMGVAWLEDFMDECDGCTIDAIAIHIYDSASNAAYFKKYISDAGTKFGKPVWVTEFGASGSVDAQSAFLKDMVPFLNNLASVERFAYFGDFEGTFVQNGKLLPLGQAYASA